LRPPVVGFDVAGFEYTSDGQRLRYLGVVTDWDEDPFEVYLQISQLGKTAATGVVVFPNRKQIYDFLHHLKTAELNRDLGVLPEERHEYSSVPNVQALHEQLISEVPLLNGIALLPDGNSWMRDSTPSLTWSPFQPMLDLDASDAHVARAVVLPLTAHGSS